MDSDDPDLYEGACFRNFVKFVGERPGRGSLSVSSRRRFQELGFDGHEARRSFR